MTGKDILDFIIENEIPEFIGGLLLLSALYWLADILIFRRLNAWLRKQARGAWAAWVAYRASYVFRDVLGEWPVVRHVAPGVLVMKAPYVGPRRVQGFGGVKPAILTGMAFGALYFVA